MTEHHQQPSQGPRTDRPAPQAAETGGDAASQTAAQASGAGSRAQAEAAAHGAFDRRATSLTDVDPRVFDELLSMRGTIDNIDAALVHLLAERFRATQRVGYLKAAHDLPAGDPNREAAQIKRLRALAETANLDPEFAEKFLNFIISEVIRHHERIAVETGVLPAVSPPAATDRGNQVS